MKSKLFLFISLFLVFSTACQTEEVEVVEELVEEVFELVGKEENIITEWTGGGPLEADLDTFEVLEGGYFAKDKDRLYVGGHSMTGVVILNTDPSEVEFINDFLFIDSTGVFGPHYPVSGESDVVWSYLDFVDIDSFELINDAIAKDQNHIFELSHEYFGFSPSIRIIEELDVDTFDFFGEPNEYAYFIQDEDTLIYTDEVYFMLVIPDEFIQEDWVQVKEGHLGLWTYQSRIFSGVLTAHGPLIQEMEEVDFESFEVIDEYTFKDKNAVYSSYQSDYWVVTEEFLSIVEEENLDLEFNYVSYEDDYISFDYPENWSSSAETGVFYFGPEDRAYDSLGKFAYDDVLKAESFEGVYSVNVKSPDQLVTFKYHLLSEYDGSTYFSYDPVKLLEIQEIYNDESVTKELSNTPFFEQIGATEYAIFFSKNDFNELMVMKKNPDGNDYIGAQALFPMGSVGFVTLEGDTISGISELTGHLDIVCDKSVHIAECHEILSSFIESLVIKEYPE